MAAARASLEERLAQIKAREERLRRERGRLQARLSSEERKRDTRRKILLGSLVLARLDSEPALRALMERELPGFLTRPEDRRLFEGIVRLPGSAPPAGGPPAPPAVDGHGGEESAQRGPGR